MQEIPNKLTDLVAGAVSEHGKATADLIKRLGRGEDVNLVEEASDRLAHVLRTTAQFLLFWDNLAPLLAGETGAPFTIPAPAPCAPGEKQKFDLNLESSQPARLMSGLRRRGTAEPEIAIERLELTMGTDGELSLVVDCSDHVRGIYEGTVAVVDAEGKRVVRPYNVYIDPGAQSS